MRLLALCLLLVPNVSFAQDVLVSRYHVYINQERQGFLAKTAEEMATPEGELILAAAAAYLGIPPEQVTAAAAVVVELARERQTVEEYSGLIQSPPGWTICFARTMCEGTGCGNVGAGMHGIETHGDSTFNGTIHRVLPGEWNFDGLSWYLFSPERASGDSRVDAWFDVGIVQAEGDWMNEFNCDPTGEHSWLARNNVTTLNTSCDRAQPWCP